MNPGSQPDVFYLVISSNTSFADLTISASKPSDIRSSAEEPAFMRFMTVAHGDSANELNMDTINYK